MYLAAPGIAGLGWPEILLILVVLMLLFGGRKLPEMARGTGRALRIFKSETKGLMSDDEEDDETKHRPSTAARTASSPELTSGTSATSVSDPSAPAPRDVSEPLPPTHTEK